MLRLLSTLAVGLLFAASAQAAVIVVSQSGGGNATTIQGGISLAKANDEVRVQPGTYVENVIMKNRVRVVSADGPEMTVIDGNGDSCVQFTQCLAGSAVQGFTLMHGGGDSAGAVRVSDGSTVDITGNIIRNNQTSYEGAGVQVELRSHANVRDNQFLDNRSVNSCAIAITMMSVATIENNLFRGNISDFLSACIGIRDGWATIQDNRFIANKSQHGATVHVARSTSYAIVVRNSFVLNEGASDGASGLAVYGGGRMTVRNNIFAFNRGAAVIYCAAGSFTLTCNDIWGNDAGYHGIDDPVGVNGNIGLDPQFCDPLTDHLALAADSPCLSAACGVIGANPVPACSLVVPVEGHSWGEVKNAYR